MSILSRWSSVKKYIYLGVLFALSIGFVTYIFPREGMFRYEYQKGKPWMHEVLIAPWDFPVYKSETELNRQRDSLLNSFRPFFDFDTSMSGYELKNFNAYYNELRISNAGTENELAASDYEIIRVELISIIDDVYARGIYALDELSEDMRSKNRMLFLVKGNIAEETNILDLYTHKEAYEFVKNRRESILEDMYDRVDLHMFKYLSTIGLYDFIKPNIIYNEHTTSAQRESMLNEISLTRGLIQQGELIISRGELVNEWRFRVLESLSYEFGERLGSYTSWLIVVGQVLIVSACFLVLFLFLYNFRIEVLDSFQKTLFILLLILTFVGLTKIVIMIPGMSVYLIPFAIIPVIIRTFYDPRLALFILLVAMMITGFIVPNSFEFIFLNFMAGVVAIFTLTNTYRRGKLFFSASMVFLALSLVYFGIGIIQEGDIREIDWFNFAWFAGNSALILISYPLIFIFEKTFGFLSDATLFELSDTNQPLLRRLAEEAPGSFQHSMQVANLAEEAVRVIGGNPLLLRAGALYHDIGKLENSEYFTENQANGFNPHDKIEPDESAKIIIGHIEKGQELAKKFSLPRQITDFIMTHQGTTKTYYFYRKYKDKYPERNIDNLKFSYPGPKPFSKETAILMMADAVEASSRSLKEYSEASIETLVNSIIEDKMKEGQFTESPVTYKDITDVKKIFIKRLSTIYHARIAYPEKDE